MNLGLRLHPTKYWILPLFLITAMLGCRSTYYAMWESVGKEKRHLLKDEVAAAREDQAQASSTTSTPRPWGAGGGDGRDSIGCRRAHPRYRAFDPGGRRLSADI